MSDRRSAALDYIQQQKDAFINELKDFLKVPSISTMTEYKGEIVHAAEWLAEKLNRLGMVNVEIFPTAGHPIVFGESQPVDENRPTVLVYGHYDVQPVDPLDLWDSGPFDPEVRGEFIFARGATDMKGQVMATMNAIEAVIKTSGVPINFKFIFEGEEEIGSTNLEDFISTHRSLLACDICLNPDTGMIRADLPTITYALRGLAYFEIHLYGPDHDLHSGTFGGVVHNPGQVLCELVAGMHDKDGHVTLPHFYEQVRPLDQEEREELARLPIGKDFYLHESGVTKLWGESGYTPLERATGRPTLEVNGLLTGFIGEGPKTVLPSKAMAKISCRLVADQKADDVFQQLQEYLEENVPDTVTYDVKMISSGPSAITDRHSSSMEAMIKAMETVWKVRPVFRREGGTVPAVAYMQEHLGVDTVNIGFSLPGDNLHAPNEKLHLPTWNKGIETITHYIYNL